MGLIAPVGIFRTVWLSSRCSAGVPTRCSISATQQAKATYVDIGTITTNTVIPAHKCRRHNKSEPHEDPSPSTLYMGKRTDDVSVSGDRLVPFRSDKGKELLVECIQSDSSESYLSLSEQFLTQSSPPSCGVATLAMVLNSLRVDPGRVWRKPWRWFTEEMLISCFPLEKSEQTLGLTMEHFGLIAECNGATAQTFYGSDTSLDDFRKALDSVFNHGPTERRLVVAFDRQVLGQTGTGHYSPIGAFNKDADMCLVLDVARFKYPPYWVPVELMWESLRTVDPETLRSRGFFVLSRAPTVAFSPHDASHSPAYTVSMGSVEAVVDALLNTSNHHLKELTANLVHGVRKRLLQCSCIGESCATLIDCSSYKGGNSLLKKVRQVDALRNSVSIENVLKMDLKSESQMRPIEFFTQSMPQLVDELVTLLVIEHGSEFIHPDALKKLLFIETTRRI